ncbi:hypothetical protein [Prevotella intermedia]|jgi:hypothetical protein|uniref:Uncharacterized protein n=1 Tax=Prevotella intermedia TaxID=28131 RepID=A0A2D3L728_PREIN|nr:hypothetical protein [Prevotella intermedia]ATV26382.1 hypothetical protein CTM62_06400 [Prevotella intermedia]
MNQTLNFVSQDTIAALNEMVGGGFILNYLATLEDIENKIFSDCNGTFVEATGEPRPGTFKMLQTIRALKDDLRTLNTLCPQSPEEVDGLNY